MPFTVGNPGRPKGSTGRKTNEVRAAAREIVDDPLYRAALKMRVMLGEATHMEPLLWHYAYGKPVERVEVKDTTNELDGLTAEQLRREAMEIARTLVAESDVQGVEANGAVVPSRVEEDEAVH